MHPRFPFHARAFPLVYFQSVARKPEIKVQETNAALSEPPSFAFDIRVAASGFCIRPPACPLDLVDRKFSNAIVNSPQLIRGNRRTAIHYRSRRREVAIAPETGTSKPVIRMTSVGLTVARDW